MSSRSRPNRADRSGEALPEGYWPADRVRSILDQTLVSETAPIPSDLSPAEKATIHALAAAGRILDDVFHDQQHHQALSSRTNLRALHDARARTERTRDLLELQELSLGPVTTTLDNERGAFLPVDPEEPGRNLYPRGATRKTIEAFLADHPDERDLILHPCAVIRSTTAESLGRDASVLRRHAGLRMLHPNLLARWQSMRDDPAPPALYAVPYAVAWADSLIAAGAALSAAADAISSEDRDLASFLRLRARDLVANDYEGGDAAWIRGQFGRLDVIVGPYESYDDELFGVKTFFNLRILVRDETRSASLRGALAHLQAIEDALPIDRHGTARTDIPVGIFDVVADFGYSRYLGSVAGILPNDPDLLRKYGRKIVLFHNFLTAPAEMARMDAIWDATMASGHERDLIPEGFFQQSLWHEVGHYLGPTDQADGRSVRDVHHDLFDALEELKAELLSVFATARLREMGSLEEGVVRAVNAALLLECLRPVRPTKSQPYEIGRLAMANGFLEHHVLVPVDGRLDIRYEAMDGAVESMLGEVLALQLRGSRAAVEDYLERGSTWDARHEAIAASVQGSGGHRFHRFRNADLGR